MGWIKDAINATKNMMDDRGDKAKSAYNSYLSLYNEIKNSGYQEDLDFLETLDTVKSPQAYGLTSTSSDSEWKKYFDYIKAASSKLKSYQTEANTSREYRNQQIAQERETRESGIAEREAAAKQAQTQARSQGQSRGLASSLGNAPLSGYSAENYANNRGMLANLGQSTQNDYLMKMGYVNALDQQARNMQAGSFLNTLGSVFGGAGSGAQIGNALT